MKIASKLVRILLGALLLVSVAYADDLLYTSGAVQLTDPTQLGRISRNSVWSAWSAPKSFPGLVNPTTTYHFTDYFVNVGVTPYIEVTFDSVSANTFVAAFLDSYNPTNIGLTYLGDPGRSGNLFGGTNPLNFQVYVPVGHTLVVVINNTLGGNGGVGDPFNLTVQGFLDTQYTSTPEPSSLLLLGSGVLGMAGLVRRKLHLG